MADSPPPSVNALSPDNADDDAKSHGVPPARAAAHTPPVNRAVPLEPWIATVADLTPADLHTLPDSPCIGICSTLFDDICQGCGRTAAEVYNWVFLSDADKLAVWQRIAREGTAVRFVRGPQG